MESQTYMQSDTALGTTIELRIVADKEQHVGEWFADLWDYIAQFEQRFSRFLPSSELSFINSRAGESTQVSPEFLSLLRRSHEFSSITNGMYNPFVLPALQRAGYVHSLLGNATDTPDYRAHHTPSYDTLIFNEGSIRIPENSALDFGGIGKGYLADALGDRLRNHTEDFCLSLGGDMCVSGLSAGGPWEIDVQSVHGEGNVAVYKSPHPTFGIATSGVERKTEHASASHIIDPNTGKPVVSKFSLCTVVAPQTVTADVLASCILIEGEDAAKRYLDSGIVLGVLLQDAFGAVRVYGTGFTVS